MRNEKNRLPKWLTVRFPGRGYRATEREIKEQRLGTICIEARCPNRFDCWQRGTATFLIMGNVCTRNCRFCNVRVGIPDKIDYREADEILKFVKKHHLKYIVITSVTRDDLNDGGSQYFAYVINKIRQNSSAQVEVLIPDFDGNIEFLEKIISAKPVVIAHNLETVPRLTAAIRSHASYRVSLGVLKNIKKINPALLTKSGIMVGLGETSDEVIDVLRDLHSANCDIVTIGQYLQPASKNIEVRCFIPPDEFDFFSEEAKKIGIKKIFSGPFVRSSFHADEAIELLSS